MGVRAQSCSDEHYAVASSNPHLMLVCNPEVWCPAPEDPFGCWTVQTVGFLIDPHSVSSACCDSVGTHDCCGCPVTDFSHFATCELADLDVSLNYGFGNPFCGFSTSMAWHLHDTTTWEVLISTSTAIVYVFAARAPRASCEETCNIEHPWPVNPGFPHTFTGPGNTPCDSYTYGDVWTFDSGGSCSNG